MNTQHEILTISSTAFIIEHQLIIFMLVKLTLSPCTVANFNDANLMSKEAICVTSCTSFEPHMVVKVLEMNFRNVKVL